MSETFYTILGLERSASQDDIKHAYRILARKYHPDSQNPNASEIMFRKVSEAYSCLSSAERKEKYDETLGIAPNGDIGKTRHHVFEKMEPEAKKKPKDEPSVLKERSPVKDSGILGRFTKLLQRKGDDAEDTIGPNGEVQSIRGERVYNFLIDGLESLTGTSRELALRGDDDQPRMLKVKIPAGSCDGDLLRVKNEKENEEYLIRLSIMPHEFVLREGRDIILRVPLTLGEALSGVDLTVPLLDGTLPVTIPPSWDVKKRIRIKSRGINRKDANPPGDLYIELVLINPDLKIGQVEQVAKLLDESYSSHPRARFPRDFIKK